MKEHLLREKMVVELQMKFKEEREYMEKLIEQNVDKRVIYDLENNNKLLQDKNKTLTTEVVRLRKDMDTRDNELEKA